MRNKISFVIALSAIGCLYLLYAATQFSLLADLIAITTVLLLVYIARKFTAESRQIAAELSFIDCSTALTALSAPRHPWLRSLYRHLNPVFSLFLQQSESYLTTLNTINDAVIRTNEHGLITYVNQAGLLLFNLAHNQLMTMPFDELMAVQINEDDSPSFAGLLAKFKSEQPKQVEKSVHLLKVNNQTRTFEQQIKAIFDHQHQFCGTVIMLRDITRAAQLKAQLHYQANYDVVTKLFNRYKFEQKLTDAWHDAQENKVQHALIQLDMDRFKLINDNAGHAAGDQLLRDVGALLKAAVRQSDICARIGGDEFAVLVFGVTQESIIAVTEKINHSFKQFTFYYHGQTFEVGASIGITLINQSSPPLIEVQRQADAACFMAKNQGINCFQLYDNNDQNLITHQQEPKWAARINQAIENDEFALFCQPIKPLIQKDARKQHLEVLLRLKQDDQWLSPSVFLPAVERFRLSIKVDTWVVKKTFDWLAMQPQLWDELVVAINLSGDSIANENFIDEVLASYQHYQFPATAVCFEITETAAIANMAKAIGMVDKLRQAGFTIALDDFGKGFSTFSYLKNLPANYIKIDGSYVQEVLENDCDLAIVKAINTLAKSMNMLTIAEFVQCQKTKQLLLDIGVDFVQGYGVAMPAPLSDYCFANQGYAIH